MRGTSLNPVRCHLWPLWLRPTEAVQRGGFLGTQPGPRGSVDRRAAPGLRGTSWLQLWPSAGPGAGQTGKGGSAGRFWWARLDQHPQSCVLRGALGCACVGGRPSTSASPGVMAGALPRAGAPRMPAGRERPREGAGVSLAQPGPRGCCCCLSPCPCGSPWRLQGRESKAVALVGTLARTLAKAGGAGCPLGGLVSALRDAEGQGGGLAALPWPAAALRPALGQQGLAPSHFSR